MLRNRVRAALAYGLSTALVVQLLPLPWLASQAMAQASEEMGSPKPIFRVVWRGTEHSAFRDSQTGALMAKTELGASVASGWSAIAEMGAADGNPEMAAMMDGVVGQLLEVGLGRPVGFELGQLPPDADATFLPIRAAMDLGDDEAAQRLAASLNASAELGEGMPPAEATEGVVRLGDWVGGDLFGPTELSEPSLAAMSEDAQLVVRVDVAAAVEQAMWLPEVGEGSPGAAWLDALGVSGVRSISYVGRFDEQGWWHYRYAIEAPGPRKGLMKFFDAAAVDPSAFREVPASASWAGVYRMDPAELIGMIREAADEVDPQMALQLNGMLGLASGMTGVDLEGELLASLGDTWIAYYDPNAVGPGGLGLCIVNQARDADRLAGALTRLQGVVQMLINQQIAMNEPEAPFGVNIQSREVDGVALHTINGLVLSPTWAVIDDRLVLGLQPHTVVTAADAVEREGAMLDDPSFREVVAEYVDRPLTGLRYVDLSATGPVVYPQLLSYGQLFAGFGALSGDDAPIMPLPPLHEMEPFLVPTGEAAWVDDWGVHVEGRVPFIGASMFGPHSAMLNGSGAAVYVPAMVGAMLPALGAARRTARQMQSNTQMRGVHQSTIMWAQSNQGRLSHDVGELMVGHYFTAEYLISPLNPNPPAEPGLASDDDLQAWAWANTDYFLLPNKLQTLDSEEVAGFSNPALFGVAGGISVAYADNHVVWETDFEALRRTVRIQTGFELEEIVNMQRTGDWPESP
ncbi:MAG: hypothetical protein AAF823_13740 [Planctomycetota bacterium]